MACQLMMPIGVENFEEIKNGKYYYVDKSKLIEQLLRQRGKANLFLRPRRFGKSLNLSMLKYFFEIGDNSGLFRGLYIENNKELCAEYMGKYPVIYITLKGINETDFADGFPLFVSTTSSPLRKSNHNFSEYVFKSSIE